MREGSALYGLKAIALSLAVIFLPCLIPFVHAQFTDDFEDGSFLNNPSWEGDASKFFIENGQLRSNSDIVSDEYYLSTASQMPIDAEWRIGVNMKFSTSSVNYTDVFLISDVPNLKQVQNGYFVRIGNTKDEVSLYKIANGVTSKLTDGTDNKTHNKNIALRVLRSINGDWEIYADYDGGENYTLEGSVTDTEIVSSQYFGIRIKQSSASFHKKHYYDDVYIGEKIVDRAPPTLVEHQVIDKNTIRLDFDESVSLASASFNLSNGYNEPSEIQSTENEITLTYNTPIINGDYILNMQAVKDVSGNNLDTSVSIRVAFPSTPKVGDIYFSEIFPDPTPSVGLPEAEFIELYLASSNGEILNLENCYLTDGGSPAGFPKASIDSGEYLIITKSSNVDAFAPYGRVIGLTDFPTLNNTGDDLKLYNADDELIAELSYNTGFYNDDLRGNGGYTIERVFWESTCNDEKIWRASLDNDGGTPGKVNSIFGLPSDSLAPRIESITIGYPDSIFLELTEEPTNETLSLANFSLAPDNLNPEEITQRESSLILRFSDEIVKNTRYLLEIDKLADCLGNQSKDLEVPIITTELPVQGDVIFNELMFNPLEDGVDYVEIYNKSEKYIDLAEVNLARYTDKRENVVTLADTAMILFPNEYVVFSVDTQITKSQYAEAVNLVQLDRLPPMNNDEGILVLLSRNSAIDSVAYDEEQHFELLTDVNGVSLERINFSEESWNSNLWHSASSSVDFGTPGYRNSQFTYGKEISSAFGLESKTISPNGDGYQDFLAISYDVDNGTTLNGYVFNLSGKLVAHIFNQEILGTNGTLKWDGFLENGTKIPIGNYVLLLEYFSLDGNVNRKKLAFSVLSGF